LQRVWLIPGMCFVTIRVRQPSACWKQHGHLFPTLSRLVRRCYGILDTWTLVVSYLKHYRSTISFFLRLEWKKIFLYYFKDLITPWTPSHTIVVHIRYSQVLLKRRCFCPWNHSPCLGKHKAWWMVPRKTQGMRVLCFARLLCLRFPRIFGMQPNLTISSVCFPALSPALELMLRASLLGLFIL
jgi:hypothetical protein